RASHWGFGSRDFRELFESLAPENLVDAVCEPLDGRAIENVLRGSFQYEVNFGMREGVVRDERSDVSKLGGFGLQEFAASRHSIKNIGDRYGCSGGRASRLHANEFSTGKLD